MNEKRGTVCHIECITLLLLLYVCRVYLVRMQNTSTKINKNTNPGTKKVFPPPPGMFPVSFVFSPRTETRRQPPGRPAGNRLPQEKKKDHGFQEPPPFQKVHCTSL